MISTTDPSKTQELVAPVSLDKWGKGKSKDRSVIGKRQPDPQISLPLTMAEGSPHPNPTE